MRPAPVWARRAAGRLDANLEALTAAFGETWRMLREEFTEAARRQDAAATVEIVRRMESALTARAAGQCAAIRAAAAAGANRQARRSMRGEVERQCGAIMADALAPLGGLRAEVIAAAFAAAESKDIAADDSWAGLLADAFKEGA